MKTLKVSIILSFSVLVDFCGVGAIPSGLKTCQEVTQSTNGMHGEFVPQCDEFGDYRSQQFHPSTGYSWCVDPKTGKEIQGTKRAPAEEPVSCSAQSLQTCQEVAQSTNAMPGTYIPQCDEFGNYMLQQFHDSTGYTWCVDPKTGEEIEGTKKAPGDEPVNCSSQSQQTCQEVAESKNSLLGAYVPQCDEFGNYRRQQFHSSTGYSWCVDPLTGTEIEGTKTAPNEDAIVCSRIYRDQGTNYRKTCLDIAEESKAGASGVYVPQCDWNGNYKRQQVHEATGFSWCVEPDTGKEIEGTRRAPADGPVDCSNIDNSNSQRSCLEVIQSINPIPGAYVPQCDEYGNYKRQQFHSSTGYTWCVDPLSGQQIEGTKTSPDEDAIDCSDVFNDPGTTKARKTCLDTAESTHVMPGAYVPQCDWNGNYKKLQYQNSTGHMWCVDAITGIEIPGTRVTPGGEKPNC